jgi:hypothetical protein
MAWDVGATLSKYYTELSTPLMWADKGPGTLVHGNLSFNSGCTCTSSLLQLQLQWEPTQSYISFFSFFSFLVYPFTTMVVFIDLDDDVEPPELNVLKTKAPIGWYQIDHISITSNIQEPQVYLEKLDERKNPNRNAVTEALGCYPSVSPWFD